MVVIKNNFILLSLLLLVGSFVFADGNKQKNINWWEQIEEKPFAVQSRVFDLDNKLQISTGAGTILNSTFQNVFYYQVGFAYNWNERWGLEYVFFNYSNANSKDVEAVRLISGIPFLERQRRAHALFVNYSPIYGKLDAFGKLIHIRLFASLGPSFIGIEDNINSFNGVAFQESFRSFNKIGISWRVGIKYYLGSRFHISTELTNHHYFSNEIDQIKKKEIVSRIHAGIVAGLSF